jgi:hypothetical protein
MGTEDKETFRIVHTLSRTLGLDAETLAPFAQTASGRETLSALYRRLAVARHEQDYRTEQEQTLTAEKIIIAGGLSLLACGWTESALPLLATPILTSIGGVFSLRAHQARNAYTDAVNTARQALSGLNEPKQP